MTREMGFQRRSDFIPVLSSTITLPTVGKCTKTTVKTGHGPTQLFTVSHENSRPSNEIVQLDILISSFNHYITAHTHTHTHLRAVILFSIQQVAPSLRWLVNQCQSFAVPMHGLFLFRYCWYLFNFFFSPRRSPNPILRRYIIMTGKRTYVHIGAIYGYDTGARVCVRVVRVCESTKTRCVR